MKRLTFRNAVAVAMVIPILSIGAARALAEDAPPAEIAPVLLALHASNLKEIEMGQQAREQGQSEAVKEFGATLERDHTAADEKVAVLARKKTIELPPAPHEAPKTMIPAGAGYDERFAKMMIEDHKQDIASVKQALGKATDTELKELLTGLLPILEKHLETAETLEKK